nr:EOG090X06Q2 [Lepidurus arcticus]
MAAVGKSEKDKQKLIQDKCQVLLGYMLRDDDNKYCVDCDAKGPRWASWNIGVFLCIRCAGIHRNLGVHISRVKSVNLDSWTPEQVTSLQQMGNSRARAVYEANLPDNFRRPQDDSSLEVFVRAKYEAKKYIAREWVPPPPVKVSWDAEIEADIKRKKEVKRKAASSVIELPAHVTTPSSSTPKAASVAPTKPSQDLLGLDNDGDKTDIFNGFLSAPAASTTPGPPPVTPVTPTSSSVTLSGITSLQAEQDNFFNQTAPATAANTGEKKTLDKDSILALYAKSSPAQSNSGMYGMQGGMFVNATSAIGNSISSPSYMASPNMTPGLISQSSYMNQCLEFRVRSLIVHHLILFFCLFWILNLQDV